MSYLTPAMFVLIASSGMLYPQVPALTPKLASVIGDTAGRLIQQLPADQQAAASDFLRRSIDLTAFNSGLAVELSSLPASSSASALRYVFDPSVGAYVPSAQSLGPVLTERAETIGKDKLYFGLSYQRFRFDHQDGVDLTNFGVSFANIGQSGLSGHADVGLTFDVNEATAQFTYGITPWLDASYALSLVSNSIDFRITGTLGNSPLAVATHAASTGLGDGVARIKAKIYDQGGLALALATDIRIPTGDELNLQGAGAYGIRPFFIASYTTRAFSPHLNLGYQWNGTSILASRDGSKKERLPSQASAAVGADVAVSKRLTISGDVLDQIVVDGPGLASTPTTIGYETRTRNEFNGAGGVKVLVTDNLALTGNLLFRLNEVGVRSRVVPMIGLAYLF